MYEGWDPSVVPCWSDKIPQRLDSYRPRTCRPCYTLERCHYSIKTASGSEYGSLPPIGSIHGDNVGRSKGTLLDSNILPAFPRPLPDRLLDMADVY